eukprot:TRINITY_DN67092_c0_g1_i1.p1 TRINITY_DN67092_c0_g1~~TRINITY_DN67092_c0_g1_i1.p1  ORF type:complete len:1491 (-),score=364.92 TRINITY_DN67092_c0_g1_i1:51-4337(-)
MSAQLWYTTCGEPYEWALAEQKRIVKEKATLNKEKGVSISTGGKPDKKDKELEIDEEQLPSPILPSAWSCAFIFVNVSLHALFHLMCMWMISFKAMTLYQKSSRIREGCFLRVTPQANKGNAAICPVHESEATMKYTFSFQYQAFELIEPGQEDSDVIGDISSWGVRLIQCPVNMTWEQYKTSVGLKTDSEVEVAQDKFGTNVFELPRPTFLQLYKIQLVSPLAIFQFVCTALWMLDTYWKYTCFTLITVLGFEASTAFQRLQSMATLRGMSTKSYNVYIYRCGSWQAHPIEELLPGDIVSLTHKKAEAKTEAVDEKKPDLNKYVTVPCDCLLLQGNAIVNEATLTGESVPQMKDALGSANDDDAEVDAFGKHRVHALFSGTSLIQASAPNSAVTGDGSVVGLPPDNGVVCFVLRTGFNSSQGELMRMIEFSTQDVGADKIETACQLLFLLMFAMVAAGYVLKKGLEDPTRPTFKTLLRCTLIITSVVPPSLPMQMAFAVHTALMSLLKSGIFCTEPFRVPYAGKVKYCFFDKTGTLTSDQMIAVGIVNSDQKRGSQDAVPGSSAREALPCKEASTMAGMVLGGCHSLIEFDGKALGDPIEVAALRGVAWSYEPSKSAASPGAWRAREQGIAKQREYMASLRDDMETDKKEKVDTQKKIDEAEKTLKQEKQEARRLQVAIEQRFHFSSDLQRMSTICKVTSSTDKAQSGIYCFTKGSPEVVGTLLASKPDWYDATYRTMSEKGQRVLALAYRQLSTDLGVAKELAKRPREEGETEMTLAGLIAFKCETRKDSHLVIRALRDSAHDCVMLTGDAPLTALSVAQEVGITSKEPHKGIMLSEKEEGEGLEWRPALSSAAAFEGFKRADFDPSDIPKLAEHHDLIITGKALEQVFASSWSQAAQDQLHHVCIFARLSPAHKEKVIKAVGRSQKVSTLMCGDGGNDVGALKEADVGLALLSGFGNANVNPDEAQALALKVGKEKDAETALADQRQEVALRAQALSKKAGEDMARKRKDLMSKQQQWVQEELEARRARGEDAGFMGQMSAMKTVVGRLKTELKKEQEMVQKQHGNAFAAGAAKWAGELDQLEDTPMVQLGDASTAAPFTSRTPSISSCIDIIRQGRCTLLSAVQQMEIMMLESMISAYTMSMMSIEGTRQSEPQKIASGMLMTVASLAFSFARPLDRMHPVRPLSSVFHPAILFSMLGQMVIHLVCMVYIAWLAKEIMGETAFNDIVEFERKREAEIESADEEVASDWAWLMSVPFKSNLLNTVCWLVETSQKVAVIFVNYKGRPWMKGILENQPLFLSLFLCTVMVAVCAWGAIPYVNDLLNLVVVPAELRPQVMATLFMSLVGTFIWDRFMVYIFARHIFQAQLDEAKSVSMEDIKPYFKSVGTILGHPVVLGICFMTYMGYNSKDAAGEDFYDVGEAKLAA